MTKNGNRIRLSAILVGMAAAAAVILAWGELGLPRLAWASEITETIQAQSVINDEFRKSILDTRMMVLRQDRTAIVVRIADIEREIAGLEASGVDVPEVFFRQLIDLRFDLDDLVEAR